jgi:hypothetical protein
VAVLRRPPARGRELEELAAKPLSLYTMRSERSGLILGYGRLHPESAPVVVRRLFGA